MGIDLGASATKAVLLDGSVVRARALRKSGANFAAAARACLDETTAAPGISAGDVGSIVATGYGRRTVEFATSAVTEITCHARGCYAGFRRAITIVDIGGQDNKVITLGDAGQRRNFKMNRKCAAGTGAFLEKTARYMGYTTAEIGPLVGTSKDATPISGVCAVFAESEVINHLSQGVAPADIMHGAIVSLVGRSVQLMKRVQMEPEFTLIGGILRFETMARVVREALHADVNVPEPALVQFVSAYGAALLGQRRLDVLSASGAVLTSGSGE